MNEDQCLIHVRLSRLVDWQTLKTLRLEALQDSPDAFTASYTETQKHSDHEWQTRAAQQTACRYFLALEQEEAVGMVGLSMNELSECNVVAMWVKPAYRAQGVAALLMQCLKQFAKQHTYMALVLRVAHSNQRAFRFYQKQGFSLVAISVDEQADETSQKMVCELS